MIPVTTRTLRGALAEHLDRVAAGEAFRVTRNGETVALLVPVGHTSEAEKASILAMLDEVRERVDGLYESPRGCP